MKKERPLYNILNSNQCKGGLFLNRDAKPSFLIKVIKDYVIPCLLGFFAAIFINKFICFTAYVPSASMEPTIMTGDFMIVSRVRHPEKLNRGDVVVFESKEYGKTFVKRLIAVGGDTVELKSTGEVYLNGELLEETYVVNKQTYQKEQTFAIPEGHYFFLGDNRPNSGDAREWENPFIPAEDILGKALFTLFPFENLGKID